MARVGLKQWCKSEGIAVTLNEQGRIKIDESPELLAVLEDCVTDSVYPALCDEGCEVEPDGECEHGAPSLLLACGVI